MMACLDDNDDDDDDDEEQKVSTNVTFRTLTYDISYI
jgi:hypothetical protein